MRAIYAFGLILVYCEVGNQISSQFDEISIGFHELDWYTFPEEIQRMLPTISIVSQQPQQLIAYGGAPSSRDTFKRVIFILFRF